MEETNYIGNITTIINWLALLILPYVTAYGLTQEVLVAILSSIVGLIFAYINSSHLNNFKFLGNDTNSNDIE